MAEKVSGSALASRKSSDYNTEIRTKLGARLKAYYESMQDIPVPNHLADLIDHLSEAEELGSSAHNDS
jgi:Anti-sigma factor NepR